MYNKDLNNLYIKIKENYLELEKILNTNGTQKDIKDFVENKNTYNCVNIKKLAFKEYDLIKQNFENIFKFNKVSKELKLIQLKINRERDKDIILIILFIMSDFVISSKIDDNVIRYNKVFEYLNNRFKKQYIMLIKQNIELFSSENLYTYINAILESMNLSNIINIKIQKVKNKSYKYIEFKNEFLLELSSQIVKQENIPRIEPFIIKNDYNIKELINFNKEKSESTTLSSEIINNLNYLNSVEIVINKNVLENYKENIENIIDEFTKSNISEYIDIEDYLIKNERSFLPKNDLIINYNTTIKKALIIINAIHMADIYKNKTIYFKTFLDFRGRIYYNGWGLNPQSKITIKKLLSFKDYNGVVRLDVNASGFQILGIIFKDEKLLNLTNVFNNIEKNDIYTYLSQKIFKNYDRKVMKNIIMCLLYNEGDMSRAKKIIKNNLANDFFEAYLLSKKVDSVVSKEIKSLYIMKNLIKKILEKEDLKIVMLLKNKFIIAQQLYVKQYKKSTSFKSLSTGKRLKITLKYDKHPLELDKTRTKLSTIPNFIHCLDAYMLNLIICKLKNDGIPIMTSHDAIVAPKIFYKEIQKAYKEIVLYVFNENILLNFIIENEIEDDDLKKYLDNNKDILNYTNINNNILNEE